ncbi:MAG: cytochrome c [Acidobacteria bacterium]|nr:cytochrome c [Acidobacteriota bacterium]
MKRVRRSVLIVATVGMFILVLAVSSAGAQTPTFTKDVAPILYKSCVNCHRDGDIAPMSLVTYQDVRPWAKSIKTQVTNRTMPPWGANPLYGKFRDDRSLSQDQIDTIVQWVDGGALKGNDADLPAIPKFASGWSNGEPDIVIEMPVEFELPAEGEIPVTDFFVKAPFTEDVYVKGVEVRPGTPGVVHHAGIYVIDKMPDGAKLVNGRIVNAEGKLMTRNQVARAAGGSATQELQKLLSFVPGRGFERYQDKAGQLVKAGALINFYMHYQPTGEPSKDRTKVGLYLAKKGGEVTHQIYHSFNVAGPTTYIVEGEEVLPKGSGGVVQDEGGVDLPNIPPYAENFKVVSTHSITEPITLYGLTPHLHLRGKSMRYTLTTPDGRDEVLLDVPKYDFNWQIYYELETPRKIPAGSKVTVTTLFDNSAKNKYNPAPEKEVWWSEQSWDEMYAPQARVTVDSRDLRKNATNQQ